MNVRPMRNPVWVVLRDDQEVGRFDSAAAASRFELIVRRVAYDACTHGQRRPVFRIAKELL